MLPTPVQPCDSSGTINAQFLLTTSLDPAVALDPAPSDTQTGGRPRRTGSLALFFRKVRAAQASVKIPASCGATHEAALHCARLNAGDDRQHHKGWIHTLIQTRVEAKNSLFF